MLRDIDILKEIFENQMGYILEFKELPWKRAQKNVEKGAADLLVTVVTKERLEYAIKSDFPILQSKILHQQKGRSEVHR